MKQDASFSCLNRTHAVGASREGRRGRKGRGDLACSGARGKTLFGERVPPLRKRIPLRPLRPWREALRIPTASFSCLKSGQCHRKSPSPRIYFLGKDPRYIATRLHSRGETGIFPVTKPSPRGKRPRSHPPKTHYQNADPISVRKSASPGGTGTSSDRTKPPSPANTS